MEPLLLADSDSASARHGRIPSVACLAVEDLEVAVGVHCIGDSREAPKT